MKMVNEISKAFQLISEPGAQFNRTVDWQQQVFERWDEIQQEFNNLDAKEHWVSSDLEHFQIPKLPQKQEEIKLPTKTKTRSNISNYSRSHTKAVQEQKSKEKKG